MVPAALAFALLGVGSWTYNAPQQHRLVELCPKDGVMVVALNGSAIYAGIALSSLLGALLISVARRLYDQVADNAGFIVYRLAF